MKKLFAFLFCLVLTFALVACKKDNTGDDGSKEAKEITVIFETNGGSTIASQKVTLNADGTVSFKLPNDPLKEGFKFAGWYLDDKFTTEFKSLDVTQTSVTLYAKWEEEGLIDQLPTVKVPDLLPAYEIELAQGINFAFEVELNAKLGEEDLVNGKLEVALKSEKLVASELKDIDLALSVKIAELFVSELLTGDVEEEGEDLGEGDPEPEVSFVDVLVGQTFNVFLEDGFLYLEIPGALLGAEQSMVMSIDVAQVESALKEKLASVLAVLPVEAGEAELPEDFDVEAILEMLSGVIESFVEQIKAAGISENFGTNLGLFLASLMPVPQVQGNKTIYTIDQTYLNGALDSFYAFFSENIDDIAKLIVTIVPMFGGEEIELPTPEENASAIQAVQGAIETIKQVITLGTNQLAITKNDEGEIVASDLTVDVTVTEPTDETPDVYTLKGTCGFENTDTKTSERANFNLATTDGAVRFAYSLVAEKKSENKSEASFDLEFAMISGLEEQKITLAARAESESKDNELVNKLQANAEVLGQQASLTFSFKVINNGTYTKVPFDGKDAAMDMTESLLDLIDSLFESGVKYPIVD